MNMHEKIQRAQRRQIMRRAIGALSTSVASIQAADGVTDKGALIKRQFADCRDWIAKSFAETARGDESDDADRENRIEDDDGDADPDKGRGDDTFRGLGDGKERKEKSMDWQTIGKQRGGIIAIAKVIAAGNDACGLDEATFTQLITSEAVKRFPNMRPDAAFAALYTGPDGLALRKAMPIVVSLQPMTSGSVEEQRTAVDDTEQSEAYKQLMEIGRQKWPTASEAQAFARALTDPENAELANKAHRRPAPTTSFPFPR